MARWIHWLPMVLLASVLFWTTALGLGLRSLQAFTGDQPRLPCGQKVDGTPRVAPAAPTFVGGTSGVDVQRAATPFGQTAW